MPSLLPGYEYDIFISYRQNDNRSGWVTEFVKALQEELSATIKDPVSVYFDTNPHDGLLETHDVNKTLEGKLKCLVFIPIISQTYCDAKSFAWQHEFCAFNQLAKVSSLGRDIKLANGNVTSRILPVQIHDLDAEDKAAIEKETGNVLRAIDFIHKSAGVNRPLTSRDDEVRASGKILYRDQVNKVANAVKEITATLNTSNSSRTTDHRTTTTNYRPETNRRRITITMLLLLFLVAVGFFFYKSSLSGKDLDKSIAVLPFTDMSPGHDQEYLGDGIAEDIITALSKIKDLKVIGRTSSFQFKGEKADLREIGSKLNVSTVLEGSVMKSGNKIRITAQLISVNDGSHIWSEQYNKSMDDIFSIQDEISNMIAAKMKMTILGNGDNPAQVPTANSEAYENVLYGMQLMNRGFENANAAIPFFEKAIQLDSNYISAYEQLAAAYFFVPFTDEMSTAETVKKIMHLVQLILKLDKNSFAAHHILFNVYWIYEWDWGKAEEEYKLANAIDDKPTIGHALYRFCVYDDFKTCEAEFLKVINQNPLDKDAFRLLGSIYERRLQHDKALEILNRCVLIDPTYGGAYVALAFVYTNLKEYKQASDLLEKAAGLSPRGLDVSAYINVLMKLGKEQDALALFNSTKMDPVPTIWHAQRCFVAGKNVEGFEWLEKAFNNRHPIVIQFRSISDFDPVRDDPRFLALIKRLNLPN